MQLKKSKTATARKSLATATARNQVQKRFSMKSKLSKKIKKHLRNFEDSSGRIEGAMLVEW